MNSGFYVSTNCATAWSEVACIVVKIIDMYK
jgi:hypothetical protein